MDPKDDEMLDRLLGKVRGPAELTPKEKELAAKWPSIVDAAAAELGRRRRRRFFLVGLAIAVLLGLAALAAHHLIGGGHERSEDERVTAGGSKDLADLRKLEACWDAVGFDEGQKDRSAKIAAAFRARFESAGPVQAPAIRRELREQIGGLLSKDQRERFRRFCDELDAERGK